jgi:hypothetical protein
MANKVQAGRTYVYRPVGMDLWDSRVYNGAVHPGDYCRVVNLHGCPRANTMGHCHINTMDDKFAGLVLTNSLVLASKWDNRKTDWKGSNDEM